MTVEKCSKPEDLSSLPDHPADRYALLEHAYVRGVHPAALFLHKRKSSSKEFKIKELRTDRETQSGLAGCESARLDQQPGHTSYESSPAWPKEESYALTGLQTLEALVLEYGRCATRLAQSRNDSRRLYRCRDGYSHARGVARTLRATHPSNSGSHSHAPHDCVRTVVERRRPGVHRGRPQAGCIALRCARAPDSGPGADGIRNG